MPGGAKLVKKITSSWRYFDVWQIFYNQIFNFNGYYFIIFYLIQNFKNYLMVIKNSKLIYINFIFVKCY
jgi:hypothetical protein